MLKKSYTYKDIFFSKLLCYLILVNPFIFWISLLDIKYLDTFIISIGFISIMIKNYKFIKQHINLSWILIYLVFIILWLTTGFVYEDNLINWLGIGYMLIFGSLPWFIIGQCINNYECLLEYLRKIPILLTIICIVTLFFKKSYGYYRTDDMLISYSLLPAAVISLYAFFEDKSIIHLFNCIVATFFILIAGSRGPLIGLAVFFILYIILNFRKRKKLVFILICSGISVGIYLYNNFYYILINIINIINDIGFSSRTLQKLLDGTITSSTGRNYIADVCIEIIKQNPLFGVGIGVDRFYIYNGVRNTIGLQFSSSYPHNLVYEILVQYGIIFGSGILILLIWLLYKALIIRQDMNFKNTVIILISIGLMQLMFSSTYIQSEYFFLLIGMCLGKLLNRRLIMYKGEVI